MVAISPLGDPGDQDGLRRVLDEDGAPLPGAKVPAIPDDTLRRLFDEGPAPSRMRDQPCPR
jgi:hypothetical protein